MSQFKPISEWIAEGVNPAAEGYKDETGLVLIGIDFTKPTPEATLTCQGGKLYTGLDHPVAPPAQKRLSDEELLVKYRTAYSLHESREIRTQILQRMKGPTRGEVARKLADLHVEYSKFHKGWDNDFADAERAFLSMFPEGE